MRCVEVGLILAWLLTTSAADAKTYRATILHPSSFVHSSAVGNSETSQVGIGSLTNAEDIHALLWSDTPESVIDLHPAGYIASAALGTGGTMQVGSGRPDNADSQHALLWNGSADSVIDLHPSAYDATYAVDIWDTVQVGGSIGLNFGDAAHALLWQGTASSVVDLHPPGFSSTYGNAIWQNTQVGSGWGSATGDTEHALLWNGTAESVVDLHPSDFPDGMSEALDVWENSQVGQVTGDGSTRAYLWHGTAQSGVDLSPMRYKASIATSIWGDLQVGYGYPIEVSNDPLQFITAIVWNGTASSAIDLHQFLPNPETYSNSWAWGVAANGDIVGSVTTGPLGGTGDSYAVVWSPIPEPQAWSLFAWSTLIFGMHRKSVADVLVANQ